MRTQFRFLVVSLFALGMAFPPPGRTAPDTAVGESAGTAYPENPNPGEPDTSAEAAPSTTLPTSSPFPDITCVPSESDLVVYLDLHSVLNNPMAVRFYDSAVQAKDRESIKGVEQSMGLNAQKDLTAMVVFGSSETMDHLSVGVLGIFKPVQMMGMASLTEGYKTIDLNGQTVHYVPQSEKKYITFLDDRLMLVADDLPALEKSIAAAKAADPTFSTFASEYATLPKGKKPLVWVLARDPDLRSMNLPGVLGQATAEYASLVAYEDEGGFSLDGRVRIQQEDLAQQALYGIQGLLSIVQMAVDDPDVRGPLSQIRIAQGEDKNTIKAHFHVDASMVEGLMGKAGKHGHNIHIGGSMKDHATSPSAKTEEAAPPQVSPEFQAEAP